MKNLWSTLVVLACALPLTTGCIVEEEGPRGISYAPTDGAGGDEQEEEIEEDDVVEGTCDPDEVRTCKVQINKNNCFVGEQICEDGVWSDCLEADDVDNG